MRKIKAYLYTSFPGREYSEVFNVDKNLLDSEIDKEVKEWANEQIEWEWYDATESKEEE